MCIITKWLRGYNIFHVLFIWFKVIKFFIFLTPLNRFLFYLSFCWFLFFILTVYILGKQVRILHPKLKQVNGKERKPINWNPLPHKIHPFSLMISQIKYFWTKQLLFLFPYFLLIKLVVFQLYTQKCHYRHNGKVDKASIKEITVMWIKWHLIKIKRTMNF